MEFKGKFMSDNKYNIEQQTLSDIIKLYGFTEEITDRKEYCNYFSVSDKEVFIKFVFGITLADGTHLILKLFHEDKNTNDEKRKIENQSTFSELLRSKGIKTPKRYKIGDTYSTEWTINGQICIATIEDWCGDEITQINTDIAHQIGVLMATIHIIAINSNFRIGSKTLFCAAYKNDVDDYTDFCKICENEHLNQNVVVQIKTIHDSKLERIRKLWKNLPVAATQGDFSINNLSMSDEGIIVFDYNHAGDEVLVSDLILEGLLVAYEMDLPTGTPESFINELFMSLLKGYFSVRRLTEVEQEVAWDIYTLYQSLWFSKIKYNDNSLEKLVAAENFDLANSLLEKMLSDISSQDDGRFNKQ